MSDHHEVVPIALLVAKKEVLAVRGVDPAPVMLGLGHRGHGRVLMPLEPDAQGAQAVDHRLLTLVHAGIFARAKRRRKRGP